MVGRVDSLTLDMKKNKVIASVRIQIPDIKIPNDSKFLIRTSGYVGDKFLDIALGMSDVYIMDGQEVVGAETVDPFKSLEKVSKVLDRINPELLAMDIQDTATNASSVTKNADKAVSAASKEFSLALNQRFLLPKLLFGKVLPDQKTEKKKKNTRIE